MIKNDQGIWIRQFENEPDRVVDVKQLEELSAKHESVTFDKDAQQAAYEAYADASVQRYIEAQARRTPEQLAEEAYERRAAFGEGCTVIDVLTGETYIS